MHIDFSKKTQEEMKKIEEELLNSARLKKEEELLNSARLKKTETFYTSELKKTQGTLLSSFNNFLDKLANPRNKRIKSISLLINKINKNYIVLKNPKSILISLENMTIYQIDRIFEIIELIKQIQSDQNEIISQCTIGNFILEKELKKENLNIKKIDDFKKNLNNLSIVYTQKTLIMSQCLAFIEYIIKEECFLKTVQIVNYPQNKKHQKEN